MLPMGIYTMPEISAVGETEESCREKGMEKGKHYEVGRAHYAKNARGLIIGDTSGLLKLIFRRSDRQLLGVHVIGDNATELIHLGMEVLESHAKLDEFVAPVFTLPTLA